MEYVIILIGISVLWKNEKNNSFLWSREEAEEEMEELVAQQECVCRVAKKVDEIQTEGPYLIINTAGDKWCPIRSVKGNSMFWDKKEAQRYVDQLKIQFITAEQVNFAIRIKD